MRNTSIRFFTRKASLLGLSLVYFGSLNLAAPAQSPIQRAPAPAARNTVAFAMPAGVPDPPSGLSAGGIRRWIQLWTEVHQIEKMLQDRGYADDQLNGMLARRLEEIRQLIRGSK